MLYLGGWYDSSDTTCCSGLVDVYNISLTHSIAPYALSENRSVKAVTVGDYALFVGGGHYDDGTTDVVDVFSG